MSLQPTTAAIRLETHFGDRLLRCYVDRPSGLYAMLQAAAQRYPESEALVCGDVRLSWRGLDERVGRIAAGLKGMGIVHGDRVAILLGNRVEFVEAAFALAKLGAIIVPLSTREQAPGIAHILNDSGAVLLIYEEELRERLPGAPDVSNLRHRVSVGSSGSADDFSVLRASAKDADAALVDEEDTAAILYTSGTTGKPKGAMLTHLNIVHSALHYQDVLGLSSGDRFIAAVPLSHVTGLVALMATAVRCAATLIIMPAFKADAFLELAARERMSYTLMVPAMYKLCLIQSDCGRYDLSHWRIGAFGGAIMPQATIQAVAQTLPNLTLVNVYGATETTSPSTIMPPGANGAQLDSVGKAVPCGDIMIVDDAGTQVPPGSAGELWIKGPMVVQGYWNNPAATADSFIAGYWKSGDIGSVDEHGYVSVFDRKKDIINRGGYKIYSSEVENLLCRHPDILEAAIVGKPCPVLGERVHAFVALKKAGITASDLKIFCAEHLADYQVPESFTISETVLPRNANGKILKRELRAQLL
jgi:acyl-CoA synthetase (AMP-forming)/AMP-acid ligase II